MIQSRRDCRLRPRSHNAAPHSERARASYPAKGVEERRKKGEVYVLANGGTPADEIMANIV